MVVFDNFMPCQCVWTSVDVLFANRNTCPQSGHCRGYPASTVIHVVACGPPSQRCVPEGPVHATSLEDVEDTMGTGSSQVPRDHNAGLIVMPPGPRVVKPAGCHSGEGAASYALESGRGGV